MRDPKEFRERFKQYKAGKLPYKAGLPLYDGGRESEEQKEDPSLRAALEYALALKLDEFDKGKDVAGEYEFDAIQKVSPDAGLSYGSYYDLTGDSGMDNKLAKYDKGKPSAFAQSLNGKHRQVLDDTIDYFLSAGVDPMLIAGIVGNIAQESRFDPNAVSPDGFRGTVQMSNDMAKEIQRAYGKVDAMTTNRFIHDAMSQDKNISKQWRAYMRQNGGYYGNTYATPQAAAIAFGKVFERPNEKYANWIQRQTSAAEAYDYILNRKDSLNYDMKRAVDLGYERDPKIGHIGSRDDQTGKILKSASHPTFGMALREDAAQGYYPEVREDGIYTNTWRGNNFLPDIIDAYNSMWNSNQPLIIKPQ